MKVPLVISYQHLLTVSASWCYPEYSGDILLVFVEVFYVVTTCIYFLGFWGLPSLCLFPLLPKSFIELLSEVSLQVPWLVQTVPPSFHGTHVAGWGQVWVDLVLPCRLMRLMMLESLGLMDGKRPWSLLWHPLGEYIKGVHCCLFHECNWPYSTEIPSLWIVYGNFICMSVDVVATFM